MKTNALFKAFLSLSLLSGVLQLYFTNYMSVANTEYSAHVAESNAVPYARNDATCYGVQTSTIRCPLGENTPAEYHQSMNLTYDNARNTDQFRICSNLPLPFTESSPIECWPRLIILPSHTTSGSKLFRGIWELFGVQMSQFKEEPNVDKLFSIQSLDVFGRLDTTTAIPFMQQPLIFKSHISQENSEKRREMKESLHIAKSNGVLRGIVRIARNPGDQLMRNKVRWGKSAKRRKRANNKGTFDQFLVKSTKYCEEIAQEGEDNTFNIFHEFWDHVNLAIPETTIHYERMTSKADVSAAFKSIITFLTNNDLGYDTDNLESIMEEQEDRIQSMIKELEYEHGTLMAQICGVEAARQLNSVTHVYSKALGYIFDNRTGYWAHSRFEESH